MKNILFKSIKINNNVLINAKMKILKFHIIIFNNVFIIVIMMKRNLFGHIKMEIIIVEIHLFVIIMNI